MIEAIWPPTGEPSPCVDYVWRIMLGRFRILVQHRAGLELSGTIEIMKSPPPLLMAFCHGEVTVGNKVVRPRPCAKPLWIADFRRIQIELEQVDTTCAINQPMVQVANFLTYISITRAKYLREPMRDRWASELTRAPRTCGRRRTGTCTPPAVLELSRLAEDHVAEACSCACGRAYALQSRIVRGMWTKRG
jgi:hypothetical protein